MSRMLRLGAAFAVGVLWFHLARSPPAPGFWALVAAALLLLPRRFPFLAALCLGLAWSAWHAERALEQRLDAAVDAEVTARVIGLPRTADHHVRFRAVLRGSEPDVRARRVQLRWYGASRQPAPGETWRLEVALRPPRGRFNPGGFDAERWFAAERLHATGSVRAGRRIASSTGSLESVRAALSARLRAAVNAREPGGLLAALAVGDRRFLGPGTWEVLLATGTNHLVAISGLHVGLAGGVGMIVGTAAWRRAGWLAARVPAPVAGAVASLAAAGAYAALAGFTIPTQRALLMLAAILVALLGRRPVAPAGVLVLALAGVLGLDPLAPLDGGFWLSFAAVAVLGVMLRGRAPAGAAGRWVVIQWRLALVLAPLTLLLFGHVAVLAPLANLVAIPLVGLFAVPLTLAAAALIPLWTTGGAFLAGWAAWILWLFLEVMRALAALADGLVPPGMPEGPAAWALVTGVVALILLPAGIPGRAAVIPLTAALASAAAGPSGSAPRLTVLEAGYGHASLIEAGGRVIAVDAGPDGRALGDALGHKGAGPLDRIVLTRERAGHRGGLARIRSPETVVHDATRNRQACGRGAGWAVGAARFRFLDEVVGVRSCLLVVETDDLRILFATGIEPGREPRWRRAPPVDVVVLPAGGHRDAVSDAMLAALQPRYAVASVDADNRYGLPHPETRERLRARGVTLLTTGTAGAVEFRLGRELSVTWQRRHRRWWNR